MSTFAAPLEAYQTRLKREHFLLVRQTLDELIQRSGVDVAANQKTIQQLNETLQMRDREQRWLRVWEVVCTFLRVLTIGGLIAAALGGLAFVTVTDLPYRLPLLIIGGVVALVAWFLKFFWFNELREAASSRVNGIETEVARLEALAWKQMEPLNALFTWDTVTDLLRQVLPDVHFDRMLSQERVDDLEVGLGWNDEATREISIRQLQSGAIQGNPFVIAEGLSSRMVEKTYTGTKTVMVRRSTRVDGRIRVSFVPEVLRASVTKPYPHFFPVAFVLFGSDAAPNLLFSRDPSKHSGMEDSFFNRLAKRRTTKALEAFSRNLDDEYGFTMMPNREFETLFHAKDRSDEREFRLLFTPYAQQEMVKLLNDTTIGFGDNFRMVKERCITAVFPDHLLKTEMALSPGHFRNKDIVALKQHFVQYNVDYFKAFYFALAPLMTIPLYCQRRTPTQMLTRRAATETSAYENELIANAYGDAFFKPATCVTPCILKTTTRGSGDATRFDVIAHGYRAMPRTDYVGCYDSNGTCHSVPVRWDEYLPVTETTPVIALPDRIAETGEKRTEAEAVALLRENNFAVQKVRHIRSSYVAKI